MKLIDFGKIWSVIMKNQISVSEDIDKCEITINGEIIFGWIIHEKRCPKCNEYQMYYEKYDSEFCAYENKWLITKCSDETCEYCKNRPLKPLLHNN